MSYLFTLSEQVQIQAAINASTGLTFNSASGFYEANPAVGSNAVPLYQTLSKIMGDPDGSASGTVLQDLKNAKLWLDVAIGANGGTGVHSYLYHPAGRITAGPDIHSKRDATSFQWGGEQLCQRLNKG